MNTLIENPNVKITKVIYTNTKIANRVFIVFISFLLLNLVGCNGKRVGDGDDSDDYQSRELKYHLKKAKDQKFVNCGGPNQSACAIFVNQFRTTNVQTFIDSERIGSLECCRTEVVSGQKSEKCYDFTPIADLLNNTCPDEWWRK